jgi:hypothetical protein
LPLSLPLVWANELDRDDTTPPSPWAILLHSTPQILLVFKSVPLGLWGWEKPRLLQL